MIVGLSIGILSNRNESMHPIGYDGSNLAAIAFFLSVSGGMLLTRIVQRISMAQELIAQKHGIIPSRRQVTSISTEIIDVLKLIIIFTCLALALLIALQPSTSSRIVEELRVVVHSQIDRIHEHSESSLAEILQAAAHEINKTTPQQLDQITRIDLAHVEGYHLVYEYTISVNNLTDVDTSKLYLFIKTSTVPAYCTGAMKALRALKATLVYRYSYSDGRPIGEVVIGERDCR